MIGAAPHYVPANHATRQPRRFIWLDTEARRSTGPGTERQTWRLAVTAFDDRNPRRKTTPDTEWVTHKHPDELWRYVDSHTRAGARTVLYAHNVAYDARIAQAFTHLPALGWRLIMCRVDGASSWATWRRGDRSLVFADTFSWFPTRIEQVGALVGLAKVELPADDDSPAAWEARCRGDVAIMRTAMLRVLDWIEAADLGNWQVSSAGTAFSAYRHRFMAEPLLVHADQDAAKAERRGAWTGRCEAWRHGELPGRHWTEWDLHRAYATIATDAMIPVRLRALHGAVSPEKLRRLLSSGCVLAEVTATLREPLVPAYEAGRIYWPTGEVRTTLWDPELRLLLERGVPLEVHWARSYLAAEALADWATWVIATSAGGGDGADPVIAYVAKQWARQCIGRFGLRYATWERFGSGDGQTVELHHAHHAQTGERTRLLSVGPDVFRETGRVDGRNAVPGVMGWIMSECRRRLWEAMEAVGLEHVAYVDTDSMILDRAGSRRLSELQEDGKLPGWVRKATYSRVEILGPRQLTTNGALRAAGVPKSATRDLDGRFRFWAWEQLPRALSSGHIDEVVLSSRAVTLRGTDKRRRHVDGGRTEAFTTH